MAQPKFDVSKGHKDWYGKEAVLRNEIRGKLTNIFERYGFEPIETPLIEDREVITFKGGGEIQKEVYVLSDQGKRELALRFDQTVPLARFMATHQDVRLPFKRYVIGPVFRDGPTQPEQGRFRSFTQCDVDVLGIKEMSAEAELLGLASDAFTELGLGAVEVKINNRKLLDGVLDSAGVSPAARLRTIVTLDKMDKIGQNGVREALYELTFSDRPMSLSGQTLTAIRDSSAQNSFEQSLNASRASIYAEVGEHGYNQLLAGTRGMSSSDALYFASDFSTRGAKLLEKVQADRVMELVSQKGSNAETLDFLKGFINSTRGVEGLNEVSQLVDYSAASGFGFVSVDPSLARGLNYYTGTTLEVYLKDRAIVNSAILAGGRFDDMVGDFRGGDEQIPAVGFSFGLERLVMVVGANRKDSKATPVQLYLVPLGTTDKCLNIAYQLRKSGVKVDMEHRIGMKPAKSTGYAVDKGIPFVGYIGETELADPSNPKIALKDTRNRSQVTMPVADVANYVLTNAR